MAYERFYVDLFDLGSSSMSFRTNVIAAKVSELSCHLYLVKMLIPVFSSGRCQAKFGAGLAPLGRSWIQLF